MTKALLTKILIGVFATGTVGTVGLVVASKNPVTTQAVKSVPVIAKYVDIVTFNKGLSEDELKKVLDRGKYFYEPRIKEWKEQHGINNDYNNPDIYSMNQMFYGDDEPYETSEFQEFIDWNNEVLIKDVNKIMLDAMSRATAEQAQQIINKYTYKGQSTEPQIQYMDENGQVVTIKGQDNIDEYYRSKGIDPNSSMSVQEQEMLKQKQQDEERMKQQMEQKRQNAISNQ